MAFHLQRLSVETMGPGGETDEFSTAVITENGIFLDGFFTGSVGITWEGLAQLLEDPLVQKLLEDATSMRMA